MLSPRAEWVHEHRHIVLGLANVVGCGWGEKHVRGRKTAQHGMVVFVRRKVPQEQLRSKDLVPLSIGELPTDVIEVGDVKLLGVHDFSPRRDGGDRPPRAGSRPSGSPRGMANPWVATEVPGTRRALFDPEPPPQADRTARWRPAQPGVSIGHVQVTAGTFGACVKDKRTGETYILSNNHVAANGTDGHDDRARVGDAVLQPGAYDGGGSEHDVIGHLERFIPLHPLFSAPRCKWAQAVQTLLNIPLRLVARNYAVRIERQAPEDNVVDCAVVKPVNPGDVDGNVVGIGRVRGMVEAEVGMRVKKSGRTTSITKGEVLALGATLNVGLGGSTVARFVDQIVTTPLAQPGDSGSLVLDAHNNAVGLLFAGSDKTTLCNRIAAVCNALHVEF